MKKSKIFNIILMIALMIPFFGYQQENVKQRTIQSVEEELVFIKNKSNFEDEGERLKAFFEAYAKNQIAASPAMATFLGKPGYDDVWDDLSTEGVKIKLANLKLFNEAQKWFDVNELTEEEVENLGIFNRAVGIQYSLESQFPEKYVIIDQIDGFHIYLPAIIQMMPTNSSTGVKNILSRLEGLPKLLQQAQNTLTEGIEKGIVMPRNTVIQVPEQLKQIISNTPEESVFYAPFANLKEGITIEGRTSITDDALKIIANKVNPAFIKFTDFMEKEYLPNARESYGLNQLPNGEAWYNELITYHTSTNITAKEVHTLGLSEVARIKKEMEKLKSDIGFEGDLTAFNNFLREDPQFFFETPEELLIAYRDICKRIDPVLPKLFGKLPRLPYGVKQVPAYSEKASTTAYYYPGSLQSGVPGYFYANTYNLNARPKWEMEALSIHEAVPGHHLQIALASELEDVPEFRSMLNFTAFIEGWGLYSESLGPELGFYKDPYSKYGQLTYEMWRAIRLVVDTGIHAYGWSRQEAIDYFKMNSGKSIGDITVEIDRYIAMPGQALAYKIGELKIKELRKKAETALTDQFDIRAFHDVVLGSGTIPLDVLEVNVNNWIIKQTTKQ
ncbi:DUF885 domain-containing protein [Maribacter luteus]|uniref:DUF885 family protein n=1 Tax=Maribacter luteus TaxID=2594478 RepID=A0A6I2MLU0_9FLAO|nr:DUF885 domain-containing protein [Maribacter luteus]MRX63992.1 DUF885 family protein [Maribacter luteus]